MHLRKLVWVYGFAVGLMANYASALGLGEITLQSALNQPLEAEIKLLDVGDLTNEQIVVALGSPADFERNHVDRLYFYTEFDFEIIRQSGGAIARITTRNPVREPFLNFLVEARWPSGRLLREYTLLMDLPTFGDSPAAPVESATTYPQSIAQPRESTATQPRASTPVKTPPASSQPSDYSYDQPEPTKPAQPSGGSRAGSDSYGPVSANETLWQIALDTRPDRGLTVHQTMLAIQRLNPEAFINGNINLLRKGQVLRLPSADEIRSLSKTEAVAEVASQIQEWSGSTMGAPLNASRTDRSDRQASEEVSGRVKLVAPGGDADASGQGSGRDTGNGQALENELVVTLEELDKTRSENSELTSRIRDLESQIDTMERLVDVSNEQLRAMQVAALKQEELEQQQAESGTATDPLLEGNTSEPAPEVNPDTTFESDSSEPNIENPLITEEIPNDFTSETQDPVAEATPTPEPTSEPVATPTPEPVRNVNTVIPLPKKTIVDHIIENALWIGLGLLAVIGAVVFFIRRRNEAEDEDEYDRGDNLFRNQEEEEENFYEESVDDDLGSVESDYEEEMPLFEEEEATTEAETGDVVGEADIYIGLAQYEPAEEMLLNALAKDPTSVPIRMKLLELYSKTNDVSNFDQYYAGLLGDADNAQLKRAAELRSNISDAGEFDAGEFDITLDNETSHGVDLSSSEDAIDFNLDDDIYSEPAQNTITEETDDDDFSFDLELDDEPARLVTEDSLLKDSDFDKSSSSRYDLSFDEAKVEEDDEDFALALDDEINSEELKYEPDTSAKKSDDDLEELSFGLDDDSELLIQDSAEEDAEAEEDDFNFDFESEETVAPPVANKEKPAAKSAASEFGDDATDEFNLDMDMEDLDLEALDHEMESLDAEFADSDDSFAELDASPVATKTSRARDDEEYERAMSSLSGSDDDLANMSEEDMDSELDFLADTDEAATKLDLARAYIDMGDSDGAKDILNEVVQEGNADQRKEAKELLGRIDV